MYSRRTRGCYAGGKFSKYRVFVFENCIESFLNFFPTAFPSNYHDNCPSNYKEYSIPCRGALSYRYFYGILAKIMPSECFIIPEQHLDSKKWMFG